MHTMQIAVSSETSSRGLASFPRQNKDSIFKGNRWKCGFQQQNFFTYYGTCGRPVMGYNVALPSGNSSTAEDHAALRRGKGEKIKR